MRRRTRILVITTLFLATGVAIGSSVDWRRAYWAVVGKRWYWENTHDEFGELYRGWYLVHRWTGEVSEPCVAWWVDSGYLCEAGDTATGYTLYRPDGTVLAQNVVGGARRSSPPWLWGVTDQTEPSIPEWMRDEEAWGARLAEQER